MISQQLSLLQANILPSWEQQKNSKTGRSLYVLTSPGQLKRVFNIDIKTCEKCGEPVKIIGNIEDPIVIKKIRRYLNESGMLSSGTRHKLAYLNWEALLPACHTKSLTRSLSIIDEENSVALSNNPNIQLGELKDLHSDLAQWALFCSHYNPELAKDVLQQSYLKIVEGTALYKKRSTLKTWVYSVIRLTTLEQQRKSNLHSVACNDEPVEDEPELDVADSTLTDLYTKEQVEVAIKHLLMRLDMSKNHDLEICVRVN